MEIHIHVHHHETALAAIDSKLVALGVKVNAIHKQGVTIMNMQADIAAALAAVDTETTRIATYLEGVLAQLNRTDLTEAQEAAVLAGIQAAADRLKGIGTSATNPVPEGELPPVDPPPASEV